MSSTESPTTLNEAMEAITSAHATRIPTVKEIMDQVAKIQSEQTRSIGEKILDAIRVEALDALRVARRPQVVLWQTDNDVFGLSAHAVRTLIEPHLAGTGWIIDYVRESTSGMGSRISARIYPDLTTEDEKK